MGDYVEDIISAMDKTPPLKQRRRRGWLDSRARGTGRNMAKKSE